MTDQPRNTVGAARTEPAHEWSWSLPLPHETDSVPLARALVQQVLHGLGDPVDAFAAALAATELVANALEHTPGDGDVELVLEWEHQGFRIEVCDEQPLDVALEGLLEPAVEGLLEPGPAAGKAADGTEPAAPACELAEDGRGLLIIRSVSDRAGIRTTSHGKAIWCLLEPA